MTRSTFLMADVRSNPPDAKGGGNANHHPSLSSKSSNNTVGDEPKVVIHTTPPESRPSNPSNHDPVNPDNLTRIRGINPELAEKLHRMGITHYDQIADWSATDVRSLSAALQLGKSIYRQGWIEQAARLVLRRRPATPNSGTSGNPHSAASPLTRSKPTIATLIASAAAAIRARTRIDQPRETQVDIARLHASVDLTSYETGPLQPVRAISKPELDARIAASFGQIGAAVGRAAVAFPKQATTAHAISEIEPPSLSESVHLDPEQSPVIVDASLPAAETEPDPEPEPLELQAAQDEKAATAPPAVFPAEETTPATVPPKVVADADIFVAAVELCEPKEPDNLCLIADMPQRVADRLGVLGIQYFSEIAAFDAEDVAALSDDCELGDRAYRECWVEQAAMLANGTSTKGAARRACGTPAWLVPYPAEGLRRDPKAFAALSRPLVTPIRNERATKPNEIPPATETAPPVTVPDESAPAPNTAISPPPIPVGPCNEPEPAPIIVSGNSPTSIPVQAELPLTPPAQPSSEQIPGDGLERADNNFESLDHEQYEEAEVTIRPRACSSLESDLKSANENDEESKDLDNFDEPESLSSRLSEPDRPTSNGGDEQAAYLQNVAEASVEIVGARPFEKSRQSQQTASVPSIPKRESPAKKPPAVEQRAVSRFLKALRGR